MSQAEYEAYLDSLDFDVEVEWHMRNFGLSRGKAIQLVQARREDREEADIEVIDL